MTSDQDEKCTIGIVIFKNPKLDIYSSPHRRARKITFCMDITDASPSSCTRDSRPPQNRGDA